MMNDNDNNDNENDNDNDNDSDKNHNNRCRFWQLWTSGSNLLTPSTVLATAAAAGEQLQEAWDAKRPEFAVAKFFDCEFFLGREEILLLLNELGKRRGGTAPEEFLEASLNKKLNINLKLYINRHKHVTTQLNITQ